MGNEPERMMDGYGTDELALPIWKLCQNVGGDYAKGLGAIPGDFYCELTGDRAKELEIIVVDIRKSRTYWGRTEIDDTPPLCASLDGMTSIEGDECATCEHKTDAPWLLPAADRRKMCSINYIIMGINFADSLPLLIRAGGISAQPVRQLLTQLRLNKTLKGEYHRAVITVTSAPKKTPAGEAYNLHFKIKGLIQEKKQIEEFKQQSFSLLGTPLLPEGRDDEEPLGYTPEGTPFYSEEERDRLIATEEQPAEIPVAATPKETAGRVEPTAVAKTVEPIAPITKEKAAPAPAEKTTAAPETKTGKQEEEKKKEETTPLDLDF